MILCVLFWKTHRNWEENCIFSWLRDKELPTGAATGWCKVITRCSSREHILRTQFSISESLCQKLYLTYSLDTDIPYKATFSLGKKNTGLHTGFNGGRDRMKSRIISWALFFNRGGISPLTWKGESETKILFSRLAFIFVQMMRPVENSGHPWQSLQCFDTCTRHKSPPVLTAQQSICRTEVRKAILDHSFSAL